MSTWNYRLMAHKYKYGVYFEVHEVYYNKDGVPNAYTESPITLNNETVKGLRWVLKQVKKATKKPIIWYGENFPKEYKKRKNKK